MTGSSFLARIVAVSVSTAVVLWSEARASAQETRPGDVKTTVEVEILVLDVLALDGKDRPVLDLTKTDFEVKVGGKVQVIDGFDPPARPAPSTQTPAGGATVAPAPELERIAGTTMPVGESRSPWLHVLFYFDLEQLPPGAMMEAATAAREVLHRIPPKTRVGVVSYFGRAGVRLWDDTAIDLADRELDMLAETPSGVVGEARLDGYQTGTPYSSTNSASGSRGWDQRRRLEAMLVQNILDAEDSKNYNLVVADSRAFAEYLQEERRRVDESVKELRAVCERFALLEDKRHVLLFSQGIERVPGMNAMNFLAGARRTRGRAASLDQTARDPLGTATSQTDPMVPFDSSALPSLVALERWLASSGITLHLLDPTRGGEMHTAEHSRIETDRDFAGDRGLLQTGAAILVDATGGLVKIGGSADAVLASVVDAASGSYRIAVRVEGIQRGRDYPVKVSVKRRGVRARARSAFEPRPALAKAVESGGATQPGAAPEPPSAAAVAAQRADEAARRSRADARRAGAARSAGKPIPTAVAWKGKSGPDPAQPGRFFYKVDVAIPQDALRFVPESDAMTASVKIGVQAFGTDGKAGDEATDDLFLALTGEEYSAGAGKDVKKTVTLSLSPGAYELKVSVNDILGEAFGTAKVKVTAE